MSELISYKPPPIVERFIKKYEPHQLFYDWIVGPYGSGKTTGMFFKLAYMASLQEPSPDGIRYSRAVVVRNTMPQLRDTTLVSWNYWFKPEQAGDWSETNKTFTLRFADVECEVIFRALDTPADVARALGLEITFAILDEFREIPRAIVEGLSGRLGRYKLPGGTRVTNWGMWGASNPGTEDLWWYDYLHSTIDNDTGNRTGCIPIKFPFHRDKQVAWEADQQFEPGTFAWYFHQPSGLSRDAENLENLPPFDGTPAYYINMAKGKSEDWIKQYIHAEWGFSASGQPVVQSFRPGVHVSMQEIAFSRHFPLVVGLDPGLGGSAMIFMQQDLTGRINVLGELVQRGMGAERLITERLLPYVAVRFPGSRIVIAPDPAAANRSSNDEKAIVQTFREKIGPSGGRMFQVAIETNNRLPLRLNAIDHYCNKLIAGSPALQIDPVHCPILLRALKGGWRFGIDVKKDEIKSAEPEKNPFSHPGDAFGYGLRYYHKGVVAEEKRGSHRFTPPVYRGNEYGGR